MVSRIEGGTESGWMCFTSTTARGDIWIAGVSQIGPWLLSVSHPGVAAELGPTALNLAGPGAAKFAFPSLKELYPAIERAYRLGLSLPDVPLEQFRRRTFGVPRTTEVERLVVQRVGQDIFREALLEYWEGRCPLTGISDPSLLRASHIVPWADCDDDSQRLDVHNGLLLSALWDAAFDGGRVSFADTGELLIHPRLAELDRQVLLRGAKHNLPRLTPKHAANMMYHRARFQF